ncbi:hypothetical protein D918_06102 [Trichuris suis]|nr:hypothetical protein D918_06102 [Trichuris suis]
MYTDVPSYASRYRRDILTFAILTAGLGGLGSSGSGGVQDVPSSVPAEPVPSQSGAFGAFSGQAPKSQSQMPSEGSFAPPADISAGGESASSIQQTGFEFTSAPVPQGYASGLKAGADVPESFDVAPGASEIQKPYEPPVRVLDSKPPATQSTDIPSMEHEEYLSPPPVSEDRFKLPAEQTDAVPYSYSTSAPSYAPMGDGNDDGFKGAAYDFGGQLKSVDEAARWKRSFGSVSSVGMQFASDQKLTGGIEDVPSSLPMSSMPAQGGILGTYGGPLPSAESDMPLKRTFAPPADISYGGEAASSFQQPASVSGALRGFVVFSPSPDSQVDAPSAKSGFDFLPSVPQSFAVAPGASDVQKLDTPVVSAPDSHLSGPPSVQGADVPSMKYENYLPPPSVPEDSGNFPVHQSGRLASSYSGQLPSSMPIGVSISKGYQSP